MYVCQSVYWPYNRKFCSVRQESFFVSWKDSRAAADLEKVNKEKEKLQAQVEALKKAAHVSRHFTHTVRFRSIINFFSQQERNYLLQLSQTIRTELLFKKNFLLDDQTYWCFKSWGNAQTRQAKLSSEPANVPGAQPLMKPLQINYRSFCYSLYPFLCTISCFPSVSPLSCLTLSLLLSFSPVLSPFLELTRLNLFSYFLCMGFLSFSSFSALCGLLTLLSICFLL